jgi:histamine receptor H2
MPSFQVIAAVRMTKKMRGATNLFIVSLAWADLMLGMVVLPFSAMYEVKYRLSLVKCTIILGENTF